MSLDPLLVYGTAQPPTAPVCLQAGPLAAWFEPSTAFLRRIRLGEIEVLRAIYGTVRDHNWGTVTPRVENLNVTRQGDAFEVRFEADCQSPGIHFRWKGTISGDSEGTVTFEFAGEAVSSFLRNRIGLCVLHPLRECCGQPVRTLDNLGVERLSAFPELIEPQIFGAASFSHLKRLSHQVKPGLWATVTFEGDEFETEDQRNWTDASFKTYCTPLELPYPVRVEAGTRILQRVTLTLAGEDFARLKTVRPPPVRPEAPAVLDLEPSRSPPVPLPLLGVGFAPAAPPLTPLQVAQLRALGLAHLRIDLAPGRSDSLDVLQRGVDLARALGAGLEVAVQFPSGPVDATLGRIAQVLGQSGIRPLRVMAFAEGAWLSTKEAVDRLRGLFPEAQVGGGSNAHFCELNRAQALGQFNPEGMDFVCWPITPQVHAFDNLSIVENLEAQGDTLFCARRFCGDRPLVISPVTLKPRFNAVAASDAGVGNATQTLPPQYDTRQMSWFAAAWTLGSLAELARQGALSVTWFETHGWGGLMQAERGTCELPDFPAGAAVVYPVYHVFAHLAGWRTCAPLLWAENDRPSGLAGIRLFKGGDQQRMLVGDLSGNGASIELRSPADYAVRLLHPSIAGNQRELRSKGSFRLQLPPCGVAVIDLAPHSGEPPAEHR